MSAIAPTFSFSRMPPYGVLNRDLGSDVARALDLWSVQGDARRYQVLSASPDFILVELATSEMNASESIFALTAICAEKLVTLKRQW